MVSRGLTISASDWREPNSFWYWPSGMTTNSSSELPKKAPFLALTPTMRNGTPATLMNLSSGSSGPNSRSATCQPTSATGRLRCTSTGLIIRPRSASKVENSR